jgi:hypothetical protein
MRTSCGPSLLAARSAVTWAEAFYRKRRDAIHCGRHGYPARVMGATDVIAGLILSAMRFRRCMPLALRNSLRGLKMLEFRDPVLRVCAVIVVRPSLFRWHRRSFSSPVRSC